MQQGWIKLHRKIREHWIYQDDRVFSRYEAWTDLLMRANYKDTKVLLGNELLEVKRGQFITSIRKLCETWQWSNTKVNSFLKLLEQDGMIAYKSDTKKTVITIAKYDIYHDMNTTETSQKHHENDTEASRKHTEKNLKNLKNSKEVIPYVEIIDYLNEKAGKRFSNKTTKTRDVIRARWNEGHKLDDFKRVIDICVSEWSGKTFNNGKKGDDYLQPSTLFNGKFDERLNWTRSKPTGQAHQDDIKRVDATDYINELGGM